MTLDTGGALNADSLTITAAEGTVNVTDGILTTTGTTSGLKVDGTLNVGSIGLVKSDDTLTIDSGGTAALSGGIITTAKGLTDSGTLSGYGYVNGSADLKQKVIGGTSSSEPLEFFGAVTGSGELTGYTEISGNTASYTPGAAVNLGNTATGHLTISTGATASFTDLTIGKNDAYTVIVNGNSLLNTAVTATGAITVGSGADGTLTIENLASVSADSMTITASKGTVNVNGGTLTTTGFFTDLTDNGTLKVGTNGTVTSDNTLTIGSSGTATLTGGTITTDFGLTDNGTLSGYGTIAGPVLLNADATGGSSASYPLVFTGSVDGTGNVSGYSEFTGTYTPGVSGSAKVTMGSPTFAGTLSMDLGGTTAGTKADQIVVTGAATLGGTLKVNLINGFTPSKGDTFTLLTTSGSGSISGSFASKDLPSLSGPLVWTFSQSSNAYILKSSLFTLNAATTPGGRQTQTALKTAVLQYGRLKTLASALASLPSTSQQTSALQQVTNRTVAGTFSVALAAAQSGLSQVNQRLMPGRMGNQRMSSMGQSDSPDLFTGNPNGSYLDEPNYEQPAPNQDANWLTFLAGGYTHLQHGATTDQLGYAAHGYDVTVGIDRFVLDGKGRIGAAFSTADISTDYNNSVAHTLTDTYSAIIYGRYDLQPSLCLIGSGSYTYAKYRNTRTISFPGFNETAKGGPSGNVFAADARAIKTFKLGHGWEVLPQAGLQYVVEPISGYTESGAGDANLSYNGYTSQSLISSLGAEFATDWQAGTNDFRPWVSLGWDHQFLNNAQDVTTAFVGNPGTTFATVVDGPVRNALTVGAGLSDQLGPNIRLFARYAGRFGSQHSITHRGEVGVRLYF